MEYRRLVGPGGSGSRLMAAAAAGNGGGEPNKPLVGPPLVGALISPGGEQSARLPSVRNTSVYTQMIITILISCVCSDDSGAASPGRPPTGSPTSDIGTPRCGGDDISAAVLRQCVFSDDDFLAVAGALYFNTSV